MMHRLPHCSVWPSDNKADLRHSWDGKQSCCLGCCAILQSLREPIKYDCWRTFLPPPQKNDQNGFRLAYFSNITQVNPSVWSSINRGITEWSSQDHTAVRMAGLPVYGLLAQLLWVTIERAQKLVAQLTQSLEVKRSWGFRQRHHSGLTQPQITRCFIRRHK